MKRARISSRELQVLWVLLSMTLYQPSPTPIKKKKRLNFLVKARKRDVTMMMKMGRWGALNWWQFVGMG
ncbi:hypothetical protein HanRHA438_Chr12g0539741 [Helianthus annuus]|nr:hypothetical protein HanRHA438_Chr12g0539741 [Helianthus annuus]